MRRARSLVRGLPGEGRHGVSPGRAGGGAGGRHEGREVRPIPYRSSLSTSASHHFSFSSHPRPQNVQSRPRPLGPRRRRVRRGGGHAHAHARAQVCGERVEGREEERRKGASGRRAQTRGVEKSPRARSSMRLSSPFGEVVGPVGEQAGCRKGAARARGAAADSAPVFQKEVVVREWAHAALVSLLRLRGARGDAVRSRAPRSASVRSCHCSEG